ncbi:MAG: Gfo/Idh/MocA family protein [Planctomycetia bacterium]
MPPLATRRRFLQTTLGTAATVALSRGVVAAGPNDKLRVASIGNGGKGWSDLTSVAASPHVEVVALCDVDSSADYQGRAALNYPKAKLYADWRKLLDDETSLDAVIVSTPDHMHAPPALAAMQRKKHVYCEKPLSHTVFEARQMRLAADKFGVVTQMGNQIQSEAAYRNAVKLVHDGAIGKVKEVFSWQAGKMGWLPAKDGRPAGADPVPAAVNWNLWLGAAPERPFKTGLYHAFNWRGWQDFSTGQIGDFACHILDPVFKALELTAPTTLRGDAPPLPKEIWTTRATVVYTFPATKYTAADGITLTWIDGEGRKPDFKKLGLPESLNQVQAGSVLIGEKGTLLVPHIAPPRLFPEEKFADFAMPNEGNVDHYTSWADACRGEGKTTSAFDYSGPLTETVLLGSIALRLPGETLAWNAASMKLTPSAAENLLTKQYRKGWEPAWPV